MNKPKETPTTNTQEEELTRFFADLFGIKEKDFNKMGELPDFSKDMPGAVPAKMPAVISAENKPEFAADAPWRLEPDQDFLPLVFYIRDADSQSSAQGLWQLDLLKVEQKDDDGFWDTVNTYLPDELPGVDKNGQFARNFWTYETKIPLTALQGAQPGSKIQLRVTFIGSFSSHEKLSSVERYLETRYAKYPLPLSRASNHSDSRKWFYGDTHYHSAYTNDIKEYGGTIPATRFAGKAIGLDWVVITDHSVDLDETDPWVPGKTRWERLKAELTSPGISDDYFRFILGEEITLFGDDNRIVHMLAMGGMDTMIPGAFLPDSGGGFQASLYRKTVENIVRFGKGYPKNIPEMLFGDLHPISEVLDLLPENTLTFAAHPYDIAQVPPAKWADDDLANPGLTGHEFWNARARKKARWTDNPFYRSGWTDPDKLARSDQERLEKIYKNVAEKWDHFLKLGVDEWLPESELPALRPVFIAGTDAHGDFNYHAGMAWDYKSQDLIDDNALGKVRTVIHLPDYQSELVPDEDAILAALKKGSCVVTDGPIIEFMVKNGDQEAYMGDVFQVSADSESKILIKAHTTPEFGPIKQVEVVTYFNGRKGKDPQITPVEAGQTESIVMDGNLGFCRVQAQSIGPDGERFCCFTNPIWLRVPPNPLRKMEVSLEIINHQTFERRLRGMMKEKKELIEDLGGDEWRNPDQPAEPIPQKLPKPEPPTENSLPDELNEAWVNHMISGYKNNEKMFKRTLDAFMRPYNITIVMYVVIFIVGILFFAMAAYLGIRGDQPLVAVGFGGLSVISFISFFIRQPVRALEENLEFITWLGVAFNTYWTRLMYISNKGTVQEELKAATDDYSVMVEKIIDKHAKLRSKRPGKDLTEAVQKPLNENPDSDQVDDK